MLSTTNQLTFSADAVTILKPAPFSMKVFAKTLIQKKAYSKKGLWGTPPSQSTLFLGLIINSQTMEFIVPKAKIDKIKALVLIMKKRSMLNETVSVLDLQRLTGHTVAKIWILRKSANQALSTNVSCKLTLPPYNFTFPPCEVCDPVRILLLVSIVGCVKAPCPANFPVAETWPVYFKNKLQLLAHLLHVLIVSKRDERVFIFISTHRLERDEIATHSL